MKKLSLSDYKKLRKLVFRGARPLEFTMWKCVFENGSRDDFLDVLASYQNEDGGFGHNIEANNWNPNSSPNTTSYAIGQIKRAGCIIGDRDNPIIKGAIKYLSSGDYLTKNGWIGNIPSNNDYSHAPWHHYDPQAGPAVDVGLTAHLTSFILKYADVDSGIYKKAAALKVKYKSDEQVVVPDFSDYDPAVYEPWKPMPAFFVGSPDSEYYPELKGIVDGQLDAIVDRLHNTNELPVGHEEDIEEWERKVPRADGKKWNDSEQIIGSYYWASSDFISEIDILNKFGRLDFQLPIHM